MCPNFFPVPTWGEEERVVVERGLAVRGWGEVARAGVAMGAAGRGKVEAGWGVGGREEIL